jgi:glucose/mannose-6-phosphate isomerase
MGRNARTAIRIVKGYVLPAYVTSETPVICISYSGNTEEVLTCFQFAQSRGCPLGIITSGGELADEAVRTGVATVTIPGGLPPRAAIGYLFTPLIRLVSNSGLYTVTDEEIGSAIRHSRRLAAKYSLDGDPAENTALQLTKKLYGKVPLIYSGNGLLAGIAYRWKCQFNENSKSMAFSNMFPELGHNEVMGWDCPARLREDLFLVMLRDSQDHLQVQKRMEITFRELESEAGGAMLVDSEGEEGRAGRLSRLLSVLLLGDFTSVYLAVEYGKDPTPIERIETIKQLLRSED